MTGTELGTAAHKALQDSVPEHLQGGLIRYFENRVRTGSFLHAVLTNDLDAAISKADKDSLAGLRDLLLWLWNHAPAQAWGSAKAVNAWLKTETPDAN